MTHPYDQLHRIQQIACAREDSEVIATVEHLENIHHNQVELPDSEATEEL